MNFGIEDFSPIPIDGEIKNSIFFLDIEIPRIGTDTKVKIELVPLGLYPKESEIICFSYRELEKLLAYNKWNNEQSAQSVPIRSGTRNPSRHQIRIINQR